MNTDASVCALRPVVHALHVVLVFACLTWRVGVRGCPGAGVRGYFWARVRDCLGAGVRDRLPPGPSVALKCGIKRGKGGGSQGTPPQ